MVNPLKAVWIIALLAAFPLFAQESAEDAEESGEEAAVEQPADAQEEAVSAEAQEEEKAAEEQAAEKEETSAPPAAEPAPAVAEPAPAVAEPAPVVAEPAPAVAPEQTEAPKTEEVVAEVKEEGEQKEGEKKEEEKEPKKYNIGLTNVLSQNINIDRPQFGYSLTLSGSYTMPWELNLGVSVGFAYNLAYGRDFENVLDAQPGDTKDGVINHYTFDGTPLNIELSRRFVIPVAEIGVTPAIAWTLPFTNRMLWEVYTLRSTLSPAVTFDRAFKLMEGMSLALSYTCAYAYNFAEYDTAIGKYTNEIMDVNTQMALTNMLNVSWSFKGFSIRLGAGVESSIKYGELDQEALTDLSPTHQMWDHAYIFQAAVGYTMTGFTDDDNFVFGLGLTTGAPEFENGNFKYEDHTGEYAPNFVQGKGIAAIPFAAKFTKIAATIGYNYSF